MPDVNHIAVIDRMMECLKTHTVDGVPIRPTLEAAKAALEKQERKTALREVLGYERLVELLLKVDYALDTEGREARDSAEFIAGYLIEKGVIAPPCKLGDTVWYISTENPHVALKKELKARPDITPIAGILITENGVFIRTDGVERVEDECDKAGEAYAYLSKEDADAAIKARAEE